MRAVGGVWAGLDRTLLLREEQASDVQIPAVQPAGRHPDAEGDFDWEAKILKSHLCHDGV